MENYFDEKTKGTHVMTMFGYVLMSLFMICALMIMLKEFK